MSLASGTLGYAGSGEVEFGEEYNRATAASAGGRRGACRRARRRCIAGRGAGRGGGGVTGGGRAGVRARPADHAGRGRRLAQPKARERPAQQGRQRRARPAAVVESPRGGLEPMFDGFFAATAPKGVPTSRPGPVLTGSGQGRTS